MNNQSNVTPGEGFKLPGFRKILLAFTILAILALGVWYFFDIVAFFFIAGVLSIIGHPLVAWLDKVKIGRFRLPHSLNALLALLVMVGGIVAFTAVVIPIIANQARTISQIDVDQVILTYDEPLSKLEKELVRYGVLQEGETLDQTVSEYVVRVMEYIDVSTILQRGVNIAGFLFVGVFAVLFMTFFFLKEDKLFFNGILLFVPSQYKEEAINILYDSKRLLTRYFVGLGIELMLMITLITTGGLILGIENAFLVGFLGGMMNVIPYLGPIIGATIGALLVATTNLGADLYTELIPMVGGILGVFVISNLIDNLVFQPIIYSNSVLAHPLEIFIVILMAGSLAGIPGMIFAIPAYTVLRIVAREFLTRYEFVQRLTKRIARKSSD
jgi:predicted PurR-regulated permease PerM